MPKILPCIHCDVRDILFNYVAHHPDPLPPSSVAALTAQAMGDLISCCPDKKQREAHFVQSAAAMLVAMCRASNIDRRNLEAFHVAEIVEAISDIELVDMKGDIH